jgi:hypothetical protein
MFQAGRRMDANIVNRFRDVFTNRSRILKEWLNSSNEHKAQVCLGLEGNTPCEEDISIIPEIDKALERIDNDEFGICTVCHEHVEPEVLEFDFTKEVCLDHYSEAEKRLLERDLEMAAKLQRQLLPHQLPSVNGIQFAVHTEAAGIVGGDYFDFFCGTDNMQGIVIADVMGKGLPASMLMANLQASLRILGPENDNMSELAGRINELFRFNAKLTGFISMFIGKLNSNTGLFEYCNAGHNPPIYYEAATKSVKLLKPTGPAIGLITESKYTLDTIKLSEGDILLLYTDGATESRNEDNEEFGLERLTCFVKDSAGLSADKLLSNLKDKLKSFTYGESFDDITLLVVKKDSQPIPLRSFNNRMTSPGE